MTSYTKWIVLAAALALLLPGCTGYKYKNLKTGRVVHESRIQKLSDQCLKEGEERCPRWPGPGPYPMGLSRDECILRSKARCMERNGWKHTWW